LGDKRIYFLGIDGQGCKGPPGRGGGGYGAGELRLGFERREEESGAGRGAGGAERERGEVGKEQSLFYCLLRLITSPCIYSPSGLVSQATI